MRDVPDRQHPALRARGASAVSLVGIAKDALAKRAAIRGDYLEAVMGHVVRQSDTHVFLPRDEYEALCERFRSYPRGPGTELKALLKTIGIVAKPNCSCNKRAKIMDEKGCDWCEEHIDEIDGWLAEEAKKRKLPYLSLAGKTLIRLAIRRARKKGTKT